MHFSRFRSYFPEESSILLFLLPSLPFSASFVPDRRKIIRSLSQLSVAPFDRENEICFKICTSAPQHPVASMDYSGCFIPIVRGCAGSGQLAALAVSLGARCLLMRAWQPPGTLPSIELRKNFPTRLPRPASSLRSLSPWVPDVCSCEHGSRLAPYPPKIKDLALMF